MNQTTLFDAMGLPALEPATTVIAHPKPVATPPALPWSTLEEVATVVSGCMLCSLSETRTRTVFSDGNPRAKLMLIGEGPGQNEDETGIPFVGRAGQLLSQILASVGIDRQQDIYICNIVKCRPPENRKPLPAEMKACNGYLRAQIALVKPRLILMAGASAVEGLLGTKAPISKIRGQWMDTPFDGARAMPIFHPSYLLRNPSREPNTPKWLTWQDMKAVKAELEKLAG